MSKIQRPIRVAGSPPKGLSGSDLPAFWKIGPVWLGGCVCEHRPSNLMNQSGQVVVHVETLSEVLAPPREPGTGSRSHMSIAGQTLILWEGSSACG
jgi:hypothetical protein